MTGLQSLLDREEIRDLLARYAYGLDFHDWDALERSFTDDGVYDMHDYFEHLGLDIPAARWRSNIVAGLQQAAAASSVDVGRLDDRRGAVT